MRVFFNSFFIDCLVFFTSILSNIKQEAAVLTIAITSRTAKHVILRLLLSYFDLIFFFFLGIRDYSLLFLSNYSQTKKSHFTLDA